MMEMMLDPDQINSDPSLDPGTIKYQFFQWYTKIGAGWASTSVTLTAAEIFSGASARKYSRWRCVGVSWVGLRAEAVHDIDALASKPASQRGMMTKEKQKKKGKLANGTISQLPRQ